VEVGSLNDEFDFEEVKGGEVYVLLRAIYSKPSRMDTPATKKTGKTEVKNMARRDLTFSAPSASTSSFSTFESGSPL